VGWRESREGNRGRTLRVGDERYPERLRHLSSRPDPVYLLGPWDHPGPHVAVVGARDATDDGRDVARMLSRGLAERGAAVVSGLARGVDAAAHEGALEAGGVSGAILGTSLDKIYPSEHGELQRKLSRSLGLMTEIPSGSSATRVTFAKRNRILAALADVVVVVQGGQDSGSFITAKAAIRLEKPVAAVPWDCREPLAAIPHMLIQKGMATLVTSADDVLKLLKPGEQTPRTARRERSSSIDVSQLAPHEAALYLALREHPRSLDDLALAASLTAPELGVALVTLELAGLASRMPGGLARKLRAR
jgi:DNA processing protein